LIGPALAFNKGGEVIRVEHSPLAEQAPAHGDVGDFAGINVLAKQLVGHSKRLGRFRKGQ
jgi:hypothetical protein